MSDAALTYELSESEDSLPELRLSGHITGDALAEAHCDPIGLLGGNAYSKRVLVDLSGTDFLDSSGIGWLVQQNKLFQSTGGMLVFHSIPPMVSRVIQLMSLHRVLRIATDAAAARVLVEGEG
jgi:anti-anti-sigma factor